MRETTLPNEGGQRRRVLLHCGRHRLEALRALSTRLDLGKPVQYLLLHTVGQRAVRSWLRSTDPSARPIDRLKQPK